MLYEEGSNGEPFLMKKTLLASVFSLLSIPSMAADLPLKSSQQQYQAPTANEVVGSAFDGVYLAGHVGYTWLGASGTDILGPGSSSQNANSFHGGVALGYNKSYGNIVLGMESDYSLTGLSGTTGVATTQMPWFGTTRAKVGFLMTPQLMLYGTGGVAYGQAKLSVPTVSMNIPGVGWAAGAGVEYAFTKNWSMGFEYLHTNLTGVSSASAAPVNLSTTATDDVARAKVSYHF